MKLESWIFYLAELTHKNILFLFLFFTEDFNKIVEVFIKRHVNGSCVLQRAVDCNHTLQGFCCNQINKYINQLIINIMFSMCCLIFKINTRFCFLKSSVLMIRKRHALNWWDIHFFRKT
jgi:hypothetical protein